MKTRDLHITLPENIYLAFCAKVGERKKSKYIESWIVDFLNAENLGLDAKELKKKISELTKSITEQSIELKNAKELYKEKSMINMKLNNYYCYYCNENYESNLNLLYDSDKERYRCNKTECIVKATNEV